MGGVIDVSVVISVVEDDDDDDVYVELAGGSGSFGLRMTNFNSSPRVTPIIAKMTIIMQIIIIQRRFRRVFRLLFSAFPTECQRLLSILLIQSV
jgi:hypothetical protein